MGAVTQPITVLESLQELAGNGDRDDHVAVIEGMIRE
jgi:hypothetical protein